ncbi:MAG: AmmeMemoRadiSam system protein A [Candidatus Pacearchaeota archaeon]
MLTITKPQQKKAKELAFLAIKTEFSEKANADDIKKIKELAKELDRISAGVFVTLKIDNELRGCIGFPTARPLGKAIIEAAKLSAFADPRFMPLTKDELKKIAIEISLLSQPEEIKTKNLDEIIANIIIGKHGLIVSDGIKSGLLLPQVALEFGFDALTFLQQTCLKAGLSSDSWLDERTKIYRFEGIWF